MRTAASFSAASIGIGPCSSLQSANRLTVDHHRREPPTILLTSPIPTQNERSAPAGCRECVRTSEYERECDSESKTLGLASGLPALPNQSIRRRLRCCGTSMGHRLFLGSCFPSLRGV